MLGFEGRAVTELVLLVHAAAACSCAGLIWFVQVVHYPLFSAVGEAALPAFQRRHVRSTGFVVAGPMVVELAAAAAVTWLRGGVLAWCGLALLAAIWASTWLLQVPAHDALLHGFDAAVRRRLVRTNWVRTIGWSVRALIALGLLLAGCLECPEFSGQ